MSAREINVKDNALLEFQERWSQQRILKPDDVSISNFHRVNKTLGGGTYGKVELVYANQQYYAMKLICVTNAQTRATLLWNTFATN
uniref:Protein kinase domain-containing protein n=1 Tax=Ditylenchus dipsaci TaxID=166011 RepID=A0A915DLP3_9BILA